MFGDGKIPPPVTETVGVMGIKKHAWSLACSRLGFVHYDRPTRMRQRRRSACRQGGGFAPSLFFPARLQLDSVFQLPCGLETQFDPGLFCVRHLTNPTPV